jgi:hypothetical protein
MDNDTKGIDELTTALAALLGITDRDGQRLLFDDHREPVRGDVVMSRCRSCGELDAHADGCVVGTAEHLVFLATRSE